jgi:hypothetical protein
MLASLEFKLQQIRGNFSITHPPRPWPLLGARQTAGLSDVFL